MLRTCILQSLLLFALLPTIAVAQQTDQPGAAPRPPAAPEQQLVRYLAGRMILSNHAKVELGRLAEERAEHEGVKEFARKMVKEHQELNEQLAELAPEVARRFRERRDRREEPRRKKVPRPGQPQPGATQPGTTQPGAARTDEIRPGQTQRAEQPPLTTETRPEAPRLLQRLARIDQLTSASALEMTKETLQQYEGHAFDRAYVGQQIAQHIVVVARLRAIQEVGPDELRQLVQQAERGASEHLEHAQKLSDQLQQKNR